MHLDADTVHMAVREQSLKADPLLPPLEAQGWNSDG